MTTLNDNPSSPLRFVDAGKVLGQFYNSVDKTYHLAEYVPFQGPPRRYCCGKMGNFAPSREEHPRKTCPECFAAVMPAPPVSLKV